MAVAWKVLTCDYTVSLDSKTNVITCVHWEATDSETVGSGDSAVDHTGRVYGSIAIDTSDLSSFIAYESVTEANVLAWVKAKLGATRIAAAETKIANQIAEKKAPVSGSKDRSKDGWVPV